VKTRSVREVAKLCLDISEPTKFSSSDPLTGGERIPLSPPAKYPSMSGVFCYEVMAKGHDCAKIRIWNLRN
jgi:hypothetical protein